jgi:hypothetical protein
MAGGSGRSDGNRRWNAIVNLGDLYWICRIAAGASDADVAPQLSGKTPRHSLSFLQR